jgi:hypothetical protein
VLFESTYPVYGYDADKKTSADNRLFSGGSGVTRGRGFAKAEMKRGGARFRLDWFRFPAGWLFRLIEGLCGLLLFGDVG